MNRQIWKNRIPNSVTQAIEGCLVNAQQHKQMSVERIADFMGLSSHWALYKHSSNGRIPAVLVRPFERVCGVNLITRYLAYSDNKMLFDVPTGRKATERELVELQAKFAEATSKLLDFYESGKTPDEVNGLLTTLLEDIAWHRANVNQAAQPTFDLGAFHD